MASIWDAYGTDEENTEKGVWFVARIDETVVGKFRILPAVPAINKGLKRITTVAARKAGKKTRDANFAMRELWPYMLMELITEWEDVTDRQGVPMDLTPENVKWVMEQLPLLAQTLMNFATEWSNYQPEVDPDDIAGNSLSGSNGSNPSGRTSSTETISLPPQKSEESTRQST